MNIDQEAKEISVGKYIVELVNVLKGRNSKKGLRCVIFKWVVISGDDEGCFISDRFYISEGGVKFMARMFLKAGKHNDFNEHGTEEYYFNKLAGMRLGIDIKEDSYTNPETKETTVSLKIKYYLKLTKAQKESIVDTDRVASEDYEAPAEVEENENTGGSSDVGDDDIPF